jgi:hypothetical protein
MAYLLICIAFVMLTLVQQAFGFSIGVPRTVFFSRFSKGRSLSAPHHALEGSASPTETTSTPTNLGYCCDEGFCYTEPPATEAGENSYHILHIVTMTILRHLQDANYLS